MAQTLRILLKRRFEENWKDRVQYCVRAEQSPVIHVDVAPGYGREAVQIVARVQFENKHVRLWASVHVHEFSDGRESWATRVWRWVASWLG